MIMRKIKIIVGIPALTSIGIGPIIIKAPPPIVTSLVVTMDIKEEKIIIAMPKNIKEKPIMNNLEFIFSPYFKESH
jgi:hypothetical protein